MDRYKRYQRLATKSRGRPLNKVQQFVIRRVIFSKGFTLSQLAKSLSYNRSTQRPVSNLSRLLSDYAPMSREYALELYRLLGEDPDVAFLNDWGPTRDFEEERDTMLAIESYESQQEKLYIALGLTDNKDLRWKIVRDIEALARDLLENK
jgi:transcriptional regulator with XRE-family HTH domain